MAYTTEAKVRSILPTLLKSDDDIGIIASGTALTLHDPAYDVPTILKNSTVLAKTTDFTFARPRAVTLTAAATGENFIAQCYYAISDADILVIIGQADRFIDDYFSAYSTPGSASLTDWSSWLAAAIYLRQYATATEENIRRADNLWKMATDGMENERENIKKNSTTSTMIRVKRVNV